MTSKSVLADQVKGIILQCFTEDETNSFDLKTVGRESLGKMLRTNFGASLAGNRPEEWPQGLVHVCAAVELIHTASLFHDDVIDGASLRRGKPALWKIFSQNVAILFGDILYCKALMLMAESEGKVHIRPFTHKVHEVCTAETEQELVARGRVLDIGSSIRIARGKTGPLFAIIGRVCGYGDSALADILEEVGYNIGTAYQLADDLIDELGDDAVAGKTLGTDRLRKKFTVAHLPGDTTRDIIENTFQSLCENSLQLLEPWPEKRDGLRCYLGEVLYPSCNAVIPAAASF